MISLYMKNKVFTKYIGHLIKNKTITHKEACMLYRINNNCYPTKKNKTKYSNIGPIHISQEWGSSITHIRESFKYFVEENLLTPHYYFGSKKYDTLAEAKKTLPVKSIEIRYEITETKTLKNMLKKASKTS